MQTAYDMQFVENAERGPQSRGNISFLVPIRIDGGGDSSGDTVSVDQLSFNFTKIEFEYHPDRDSAVDAFVFEMPAATNCCPQDSFTLNFERIYLNERLFQGEPADLFNNPDSGESLVATLPIPRPGETIVEELHIYRAGNAEPQIVYVRLQYIVK